MNLFVFFYILELIIEEEMKDKKKTEIIISIDNKIHWRFV